MFAAIKEELNEILQGRAIYVCIWAAQPSIKSRLSSSLAYQPSPVEGYSITSCNSNNHFHSHALPLSLSHSFLCFSLCLLPSPQSSCGNWRWAIKRSQTCAAWATSGTAIYFPLIYYKPSLSQLLCGDWVCVACTYVCQRSDWETDKLAVQFLPSVST